MKDNELWYEIERKETTGGLEVTYENLKTGQKEIKHYPVKFNSSSTNKDRRG